MKRTMLTPTYENMTHTQISLDKGFMKLNTPGFCFTGFLIIILIPSDMKGLLKSITLSRSDVIVIDAIAISASCGEEKKGEKRRNIGILCWDLLSVLYFYFFLNKGGQLVMFRSGVQFQI